jgi:CRISPR/Cas system-associated endonuclease Cas1
MLNYLYAVLESEARLAVSALGLDPALGVMHMDTNARDSLACDVMEPVTPDRRRLRAELACSSSAQTRMVLRGTERHVPLDGAIC